MATGRHPAEPARARVAAASLNQLAKNLACEWARDGIRVNAVAPWFTATPLARKALEGDHFHRVVLQRTPLGRLTEPEETSGALWLWLLAHGTPCRSAQGQACMLP